MKRAIARKWSKALESGEYNQGYEQLRDSENRFCCLGVLCNLHAQEHPELAATQTDKEDYFGEDGHLPEVVQEWSGVSSMNGKLPSGRSLIFMNDEVGSTFPEIAKVIRKHWREL